MARRILVSLALITVVLMCAGCNAAPIGQSMHADPMPQKFDSEEEFIDAVKTGGIYKEFAPEKIKYYFRPISLPEGVRLKLVHVNYGCIILVYTYDKKGEDTKDGSKDIIYKWYRDAQGPEFMEYEKRTGFFKKDMKNGKSNITYLLRDNYTDVKSDKNRKPSRTRWEFDFVQNGYCFGGGVPFNFTEEDIAKYFDMEKVEIN